MAEPAQQPPRGRRPVSGEPRARQEPGELPAVGESLADARAYLERSRFLLEPPFPEELTDSQKAAGAYGAAVLQQRALEKMHACLARAWDAINQGGAGVLDDDGRTTGANSQT